MDVAKSGNVSARFSHKQFGPGSHFPGARKGVVDVRMEGIPGAQVVGDPAPKGKKNKKQQAAVRFYVTHSFIRPLRVSGLSSHQPVSGRSLS